MPLSHVIGYALIASASLPVSYIIWQLYKGRQERRGRAALARAAAWAEQISRCDRTGCPVDGRPLSDEEQQSWSGATLVHDLYDIPEPVYPQRREGAS